MSTYEPFYTYVSKLANRDTESVFEDIECILFQLERDGGEITDFFHDAADEDDDELSHRQSLESLRKALSDIKKTQQDAWNATLQASSKLLAGERLSKHEYYLVQSGVSMVPAGNFPGLMKILGRDWFDEYEIYCHLYYQDEYRTGYIYPNCYREAMKRLGGRPFLVNPINVEDVSRSQMEMAQLDFWANEYPEEFSCFQ